MGYNQAKFNVSETQTVTLQTHKSHRQTDRQTHHTYTVMDTETGKHKQHIYRQRDTDTHIHTQYTEII